MSSQFTKNNCFGYGKYEKNTNSFLNKIIRYETLTGSIFFMGKMGHPYMGVGRNLAYKRSFSM
jgi:hypothetical protein